jgi:DNA-binding SARP family transcriptional activator
LSFTVSNPLRIQLFDVMRVEYQDRGISRFPTQKAARLLAYLAFHPRSAHPREALMEAFWPDSPAHAARSSLSTTLWALRQELAGMGVPSGSLLQSDRQTVRLAPGEVVTDVAEFEAAVDRARSASSSERITELRRAADLYSGELLRGQPDEWIAPEQRRLAAGYDRVISELCELLLGDGDPETAIRYATAAVRADVFSEEACLRLMRLYAAAGQPRLALEQFEDLRRRLRLELEVLPGDTLTRFARSLAGGQHAPGGAASSVSPRKSESGEIVELPASEAVGGAVPVGSRFYLERAQDAELSRALRQGESLVLIKGPRQTGKTSMLARGLEEARAAGRHVVLTDFQLLCDEQMGSLDQTLFALAETLADELDLSVRPRQVWDADRGPTLSLRRYLRKYVLEAVSGPLVWGLDEVDRLFSCPFGSQVFALFRSWHNERALAPAGPWSRLTLAMAYATEAHLFISDLNQSPFNVGRRLELGDFDAAQVAELNRLHGSPLRSEVGLARLWELVGGHPFLVRCALDALSSSSTGIDGLETTALDERGPFGEHLRRLLAATKRDGEIWAASLEVLRSGSCRDRSSFYRLRSAGLIRGDDPARVRFRCELYARYFRQNGME